MKTLISENATSGRSRNGTISETGSRNPVNDTALGPHYFTVDGSHRAAWRAVRQKRETELGGDSGSWWRVFLFRTLSRGLDLMVRGSGLYGRGLRNARNIKLTRIEFMLSGLPPVFDGYEILHLSDLHFETMPGVQRRVQDLVEHQSFDLCVLTGDFSDHPSTPTAQTTADLHALCDGISARDGFLGVLGNHDSLALVEAVDSLRVRFLINETVKITRGTAHLTLTGLDDVNAFWSPATNRALGESGGGCKIALVHSPELAAIALQNGYALYLAGHTHGGQVCLPGGKPMMAGLRKHKRLYRGKWRHGEMAGYTTSGVGVTNIPIRFNCPGEVVVITLRSKSP